MPELRVYTRRWYILALFCGLSCHQVTRVTSLLSDQGPHMEHLGAHRVRGTVCFRLGRLQSADAGQLGLHYVRHHLDTSHKTGGGK